MKKLLLFTICFMFAGVSSFAEPVHEWELGTEVSHIKYDEPGVMEEEGVMYGIVGSCAYRDNYMLRVEGRFSYGQVDYKNSGTKDDIDDYILEFRGLIGYDFPQSEKEQKVITPYIGIGYRYLNDDLTGKTSTGASGYEREQDYFYSPIGIEVVCVLEQGWSIGATVEYDIFWSGNNKSHFSDVTPAYNDLEFDQDKGYGYRGSMKFQKKGEELDFVIEPFVRYWNIKESDRDLLVATSTYYVEPDNNSMEYGIKIAAKF